MGLLVFDGAFVVLSSLLLDDADEFAFGLFDDCSGDVVKGFINVWTTLNGVVFATELAYSVQFYYVADLDIVQSVNDNFVVLCNEERSSSNFSNCKVSKLVPQLVYQALCCRVNSSSLDITSES